MPLSVMAGVGAFLAIMTLVFGVRFAIAYARTGTPWMAWDKTTKWATGIALAIGSATTAGLIQFGDLVGGLFEFVVGHPYVVSNFGITGLGAGALSGLFQITTSQFVGTAIAIVGLVMVFVEVDEYVGN